MAQEEKNIDYTPEEARSTGSSAESGQLEGTDEVKELKKKIELLEKERDEYLNGWRRAKADLINYKNEELKRLEEVVKFGTEDMVRDAVTVLDSFDLAIAALRQAQGGEQSRTTLEKAGQMDKGVSLIRGQLEDVLKRRGVERISVSPGQSFDPALHESIGEAESQLADPGTVAEEVRRGYLIHGRVLRPARVKLAK